MASSTDPASTTLTEARLLEQLRLRLANATELAVSTREQMARGNTGEIEAATARLETLAQEFKLLVEEYRRHPPTEGAETDGLSRRRADLEAAAAGIARTSALTGGLLERMVAISRGRLDLIGAASKGTYDRSGHAGELTPRGTRLKEWV